VTQQAGTTPRQTEGTPAARLARRALRAVITVTALGVALAACSNSSDPIGNVAAGPATGQQLAQPRQLLGTAHELAHGDLVGHVRPSMALRRS
jgi:hypothetical protein